MTSPTIKQRQPKIAKALTCYLPGLGHLYAGDFGKAILLMFKSCFVIALAVTGWAIDPSRALLYLVLLLIIEVAVGIWAFFDIKKVILQTRKDYRLKDYNRGWIYLIFFLTYTVAITPVAVISFHSFISRPFSIASNGSAPSIMEGDHVISSKLSYRNTTPESGDLIIFKDPQGSGQSYVQRVIAKGGDTVEIKENQILINGKAEEPDHPVIQEKSLEDLPLITLRSSELFTLGDNRDNSLDGRQFGSISTFSVQGKIIFRHWPPSRFGSVENPSPKR